MASQIVCKSTYFHRNGKINLATLQKVCTFAPSLPSVMALTVEELSCLTNHHLEEIRVIIYHIGTFVLFIGASVRYDRWFVVNQ